MCGQMRNTAPATERGRSRTRLPSLPDRTIHLPSSVCPVIMADVVGPDHDSAYARA